MKAVLIGLILGGAVIYWFSGAAIQAVSTGAYRAVNYIKEHIKLNTKKAASVEVAFSRCNQQPD